MATTSCVILRDGIVAVFSSQSSSPKMWKTSVERGFIEYVYEASRLRHCERLFCQVWMSGWEPSAGGKMADAASTASRIRTE